MVAATRGFCSGASGTQHDRLAQSQDARGELQLPWNRRCSGRFPKSAAAVGRARGGSGSSFVFTRARASSLAEADAAGRSPLLRGRARRPSSGEHLAANSLRAIADIIQFTLCCGSGTSVICSHPLVKTTLLVQGEKRNEIPRLGATLYGQTHFSLCGAVDCIVGRAQV